MEDENVNYPTTLSWTTDSLIPKREEICDVANDVADVEEPVLTEDCDESSIGVEDTESTELIDDIHGGDIEEGCVNVDVEDLVITGDCDESPIEDEEGTELVDDLQDDVEEVTYVDFDVTIHDLTPVLQLPTQSESDHVEHVANTDLADVSIDTSTNQDTNNTAFKLYYYLDNMSMNGACVF